MCQGQIFTGKVIKSEVSVKNPDVDWNEAAYSISATSRGKEIKLTLTALDPQETKSVKNGKMKPRKNVKLKKNDSLTNGFIAKSMDILFRFGMSGKFEFQDSDSMEKHSHLNFYTVNGNKVLSFVDYRRFGRWEINSDWGPQRGPCVITEYDSFRYGSFDRFYA